jgi:uncharacterized protein (TIGR02996 family)
MTDREALYRAILDAPDDDAPRLIYADWLEEHGDPERAEFIRLQCEIDRIVLGTEAANDRHSAISLRCHELYKTHYKKWIQELGSLPANRQMFFAFRRGMVAMVTCSVRYFLSNAEHLLNAAPLDSIEFRQLTSGHIRQLSTCRFNVHVRELCLKRPDRVGGVVRPFLAAWPFPRLRTLDLGARVTERAPQTWRDRWADVAIMIANSASVRSLRRLFLVGCGVGNAGARALADSPNLDKLDILDLKYNPLSDAARTRLRRRFGRRVLLDYDDHAGYRVGDLV